MVYGGGKLRRSSSVANGGRGVRRGERGERELLAALSSGERSAGTKASSRARRCGAQ